MDFVDSAGTRYQLTETAEAPAPAKTPVWPWVVGGLALAGGLVWMASASSRSPNPVDPEIEALIAEARDPSTDFSRLVEFSLHSEGEVRRALLDNPNLCPTKVDGKLDTGLLAKLAEEFPEEAAEHPTFVLHALIEPNNEMAGVMLKVVERTKNVGLIERLWSTWENRYWMVRQLIAKNPNSPMDLLRLMGNEKTESKEMVRKSVARNLNTPVDVLRILGNEVTESDWRVREAVAENPNTPVDVLRILGNETSEIEEGVREAVAKNPNAPEDVLRILGNESTESYWSVRQAVALNPNTPRDMLRLMGNEMSESDWWVRMIMAENPSTPEDLLRSLGNESTESNMDVREAAQKALAARGLA